MASLRTEKMLARPAKTPSTACGVVRTRKATTRAAMPMIAAAQKGYQRAPTSPGAVPAEGLNAASESNMATAAISAIAAAVATWYGRTRGSLDPLELGGDVLMQLLVFAEELPEFESRLEIGR